MAELSRFESPSQPFYPSGSRPYAALKAGLIMMLAGGAHDYDYQNYGPRHSRSAKIACGEFKGRDVADTEATHVLEFTNAA